MDKNDARQLLIGVRDGSIDIEEAIIALKAAPFEDLGYAKVDMHRQLRQGVGEVIYGEGKTPEQIIGICKALYINNSTVLITRLGRQAAQEVKMQLEIDYDEVSKTGILWGDPKPQSVGNIIIATGGTSDMPVAEEAARTAEALGNSVSRIYDVGVAGLHRTLAHLDEIMSANVLVAVAGMEGALASVLGGLCDCPVIAVPTSVGYGASFGGLAALLSMLNSCASGVSVVNIDNGFGGAYMASLINHLAAGRAE
ncbi:MAG: nickel pincer cofactor biosynthesis protein LarB [Eubacteriaceae bacterium]|nr:nickel pincer cofactor biosynthesis protein LarB [Eubacteriaceae bacterium]